MASIDVTIVSEEDGDASWSPDYAHADDMHMDYEPDYINYCSGSVLSESVIGCSSFVARHASLGPLTCGPVMGLGRNRQTVLSAQNKADFTALELEVGQPKQGETGVRKRRIEPWCFPVTIMGILVLLIIFVPLMNSDDKTGEAAKARATQLCSGPCRLNLMETSLESSSANMEMIDNLAALDLIQSAQLSLDIAAPFSPIHFPSRSIIDMLRDAAGRRNVKVRIIQPLHAKVKPRFDPWSSILNAASVRSLNTSRFLTIPGLLRTDKAFNVNFWIIDKVHVYFAPLSFASSSGSQPDGIGLLAVNCSCLAEDMTKLFLSYWYVAGLPFSQHVTPPKVIFPAPTITDVNRTYSLFLPYNGLSTPAPVFLSGSPIFLKDSGRNDYLDALLAVIEEAERYIYIHVAEYNPVLTIIQNDGSSVLTYWPEIDNGLRQAVLGRGVRVKLLVNKCKQTSHRTLMHLHSLLALNSLLHRPIEIKWFIPHPSRHISDEPEIDSTTSASVPHSTHGHSHCRDNSFAYLVSDGAVHLGTNGWAGDRMMSTLGLGLTILSGKDQFSPELDFPATDSMDNSSRFDGQNPTAQRNTSSKYNGSMAHQVRSLFLKKWLSKNTLVV